MKGLGRQFSVVEYIGGIVNRVSLDLTEDLKKIDDMISGVHYLHGHPTEIISLLMQKDKSPSEQFNKYPLVCLFQDFPETWTSESLMEVTLNIVICSSTTQDLTAPQRYDRNFIPILYPIFDRFLKRLVQGANTVGYDPVFRKFDRLYWGKAGLYGNTGNIFNDRLDAIELVNLKLKLNPIIC